MIFVELVSVDIVGRLFVSIAQEKNGASSLVERWKKGHSRFSLHELDFRVQLNQVVKRIFAQEPYRPPSRRGVVSPAGKVQLLLRQCAIPLLFVDLASQGGHSTVAPDDCGRIYVVLGQKHPVAPHIFDGGSLDLFTRVELREVHSDRLLT